MQDGDPCFQVGYLEIGRKSPFEPGEQPWFDTFHLNRRLVGGQDDLVAFLVEVVEDMEENILGLFLAGKVMNIVDDQHIDHLVKMNEIVLVVVLYRIDELIDELVGCHIKYGLFREIIFYLQADGSGRDGFSRVRYGCISAGD